MKNNDPTKLSKYTSYLDTNKLYGQGMSRYLPYGGFHWLKSVHNFDVNSVSENSSIGYILEIDLKYPDKLHKVHNGYPLARRKPTISHDMLSNYYKKIADKYGIKVCDVKKLIPNLGVKTNYVFYCKNFQLYLSLGMKLTKIYKVLKFKESDWMKIYINFNTKKSENALKSMVNPVYGKTMQNLLKRTMTNKKKLFKTCQQTNFYFSKSLLLLFMKLS